MKDTVLLTGYTDFITDEFLVAAFPNSRIVITGNTELKTSFKDSLTVYHDTLGDRLWRKLFKMYDIDRIVYFSYSTAPFTEMPGDELGNMTSLFSHCTQDMFAIYVMGPEHPDSCSVSIMEKSAKEICSRTSWQAGGVNVVVSPWIYDTKAKQPALERFFEAGLHEMDYNAEQDVSFLASEDLAMLLFRLFDDWEQSIEPYYIPNAFVNSAKVFTSMVIAEFGDVDMEFSFPDTPVYELAQIHSSKLRSRFIWFPVYSLFEDLPEIIRNYRARDHEHISWLEKFFKNKNIFLHILELLFGFVVMQLIVDITGGESQFKMIDFRLLYVVIFGTMYNMRMGLGAAFLSTCSLVFAYYREGTSWITLFYEPSNWLPFIAFFTVGAICGYIRSHDRDLLESSQNENASLTERYNYLATINEDILQEKKEYKAQIIGSRDSFGKIFDITRQLDHDHPKYLLGNAIGIIERVMRNHAVGVYSCIGGMPYGRLMISSRDVNLKSSIKMQPLYDKIESINPGEVWVNRELESDMPRYLYGVWNGDTIDAVILLQDVSFEQLTLYYENLFKVLCGLISASLLRANSYQAAIHASRCVEGTSNILNEESFREELGYAIDAVEHKFATHLLLCLAVDVNDISEEEVRVSSCIRKSDIVGFFNGKLHALLLQATENELPIISKRFDDAGVKFEVVPQQTQRDMLESGAKTS